MRWFPWRRKRRSQEGARAAIADRTGSVKPAAPEVELRRFAAEYFAACGAKVELDGQDALRVTRADGSVTRYTTSLDRARDEADISPLVPGTSALSAIIDDCAERTRVVALTLAATCEATEVATQRCVAPARGCVRCTGAGPNVEDEGRTWCGACPRRTGRLVFAGLGSVKHTRELEHTEVRATELAYRVRSRDLKGLWEDRIRVAFDCATGSPVQPLRPAGIVSARATSLPADAAEHVIRAAELGRRAVERLSAAGAAFLALRAQDDFLRRRDDVEGAYRQYRRTHQASAAGEEGLRRELERLCDVYAVDVEAQMECVALVASPATTVALRGAEGGELRVVVDRGRAVVAPPHCMLCGSLVFSGLVCAHSHVTCAPCARATRPQGRRRDRCAICADVPHHEALGEPHPQDLALSELPPAAQVLRVDQLCDMSPEMWQRFVVWYLTEQGYALECSQTADAVDGARPVHHLRSGDRSAVALGLQLAVGWKLGVEDVRQADELRGTNRNLAVLLIAPCEADSTSKLEAERRAVQVHDRNVLDRFLTAKAGAHDRARAADQRERLERAQAAAAVRAHVLTTLETLEAALVRGAGLEHGSAGDVVGLSAAVQSTQKEYVEAQRAFLAWETLFADWRSAFGEREGRDGGLPLVADSATLASLQARADHLHDVLLPALDHIARSPAHVEGVYAAWRSALIDELTARCEALRWSFLTIVPANWRNFAAAHDEPAQIQAEEARQRARRCAARVAKAFDGLAARVPALRSPSAGA